MAPASDDDAAELIKSKLGGSDRSAGARAGASPDTSRDQGADDTRRAAQDDAAQDEGEAASTERFKQLKEQQKQERLQEMRQEEQEENEPDIYDPGEEGNILH